MSSIASSVTISKPNKADSEPATKRGMKSSLKNRTIFTRDNLEVMRGIADECVDLIYLDPPFNSNHDYSAPIGSQAAGAEFKDTWGLTDINLAWYGEIEDEYPGLYSLLTATRQIHGKSMMAYLIYMAVRVMEMRRILRAEGSVYLHCDPTASHYLKLMMDEVFGKGLYQSEISWKRTSAHNDSLTFGNVRDVILMYGNSDINVDAIREPLKKRSIEEFYKDEDKDERGFYASGDLTGPKTSGGDSGKPWRNIDPGDVGRCWSVPLKGNYAKWVEENIIPGYRSIKTPQGRLDVLDEANMIFWPEAGKRMPRLKRYLAASRGQVPSNLWDDIPPVSHRSKEYTGYPTQKPLKLLERIIKASSREGDVVLDPFCGCATACVAAEKFDRQWVGIDVSAKAADLVKERIRNELGILLFNPIHRTDIPGDHRGERSKDIKNVLYGKQEGMCGGCGYWYRIKDFEIDHKTPRSKGGPDADENLQLLCGNCNRIKGDGTQQELLARLKELGIGNMREAG